MLCDMKLGPNHGVYIPTVSTGVSPCGYAQKASVEKLQKMGAVINDKVHLDSGIVYCSPPFVTALLGVSHLNTRFELYSDILLACETNWTKEEYMSMDMDGVTSDSGRSEITHVREVLWDHLRSQKLYCVGSGGSFAHLGTIPEYLQLLFGQSVFRKSFGLTHLARCSTEGNINDSVVISSIVSGSYHQSFIENCRIHSFTMGR